MELAWVLISVASIMVVLAIVLRRKKKGKGKGKRVPAPGPRGLPIIGHLHLLGRLPHQDLFNLSKVHGPLMGMRLGSVPLTVASSPEMARQILQTHDAIFAGRPRNAGRFYTTNGHRNIASSEPSSYWRLMRRLCVTNFFSNKRLLCFGWARSQEVRALMQCLLQESVPSRTHLLSARPCLVRPKLQTTNNNIISRMLLGKTLVELKNSLVYQNSLIHLLLEVLHLESQFNLGDYIPFLGWADMQGLVRRSKVVAKELYSILQEIINQRRRDCTNFDDGSPKDLLDVLMDATISSNQEITDEHIKAVLMDMYIAGTDSSSTVVEWALTELLLNPQKMEALQTEIDSVVGKERMVQEMDIANLPYLNACIEEALRLHPPAPLLVPHMSLAPCEVNGFEVPAKSLTFVNTWAIGRDPNVWENPLEFHPERFLGSDINVQGKNFGFLPFGSGCRACPGWRLGLLTTQVILASLLHGFEWIPPKNLDLLESYNIVLAKATPLVAFVIPRLPRHVY